jgi:hypothetical protein
MNIVDDGELETASVIAALVRMLNSAENATAELAKQINDLRLSPISSRYQGVR